MEAQNGSGYSVLLICGLHEVWPATIWLNKVMMLSPNGVRAFHAFTYTDVVVLTGQIWDFVMNKPQPEKQYLYGL